MYIYIYNIVIYIFNYKYIYILISLICLYTIIIRNPLIISNTFICTHLESMQITLQSEIYTCTILNIYRALRKVLL